MGDDSTDNSDSHIAGERETRVSFSPQLPSNNSELVDSIKLEALKSPTSFNLSTRNLMKIPSEIGLLTSLDRYGTSIK